MYEYTGKGKFPIEWKYQGKAKTETNIDLTAGGNVKENPGKVPSKVIPKIPPNNEPERDNSQDFEGDSNPESTTQSDEESTTQTEDDLISNDGWVPLFRKSMDSQVFQNPGLWKVWTWCLMKASHTEQWVPMKTGRGKTEVHLMPGQFIFGRKTAAKELRMKPSTVRNRMQKLKNMQNLDTLEDSQKDRQYSIVTLTNWEFYRELQKKGTAKGTGKRTIKGQAKDTYKKNKKKKPYSLTSIEVQLSELLLNLILERSNGFKRPDPQKWARHIDLMLRVDKREPEEIEKVIKWCQSDVFWQNNILSTAKLRKQYDQLALKMGEGKKPKPDIF